MTRAYLFLSFRCVFTFTSQKSVARKKSDQRTGIENFTVIIFKLKRNLPLEYTRKCYNLQIKKETYHWNIQENVIIFKLKKKLTTGIYKKML